MYNIILSFWFKLCIIISAKPKYSLLSKIIYQEDFWILLYMQDFCDMVGVETMPVLCDCMSLWVDVGPCAVTRGRCHT